MRTILSVDLHVTPAGNTMIVKAERASIQVGGARNFATLALSRANLPDWTRQGGVQARGKHVRDALDVHPALKSILNHLSLMPPDQVHPLYVKLAAGEPEMIPWEAMWAGNFMALDRRWPIGRVSESLTGPVFLPAMLTLPVRLIFVISAYGIDDQQKEWDVLAATLWQAGANGLTLHVKVLTGHAATHAAVSDSIKGGKLFANSTVGGERKAMPQVEVELAPLDTDPVALVATIVDWRPNIVHFFCHGHAGALPEDQWLELATAADFVGEVGQGSVRLDGQQLKDMIPGLTNPWLLSLNCCSGGAGSTECVSLANDMAAAGFPAVVAMLEPVAAADAHEFTRGFYRSLFQALLQASQDLKAKVAAKPDARLDFEFAPVMHEARKTICARLGGVTKASSIPQWVLPVLYVRGNEPLQFTLPPAAMSPKQVDEFREAASVVAQWMNQNRDTMAASEWREVMEKGLDGVPKEFWPDANGNLA